MSLLVTGYVEVDASLFAPGVLESAFRLFLAGDAPITYGRDPEAVIGRVTNINGRGEEVVMSAELSAPLDGTELKDAYNKIGSGTVKSLGIDGRFESDSAEVAYFYISPLTAVLGSGYIESVETS